MQSIARSDGLLGFCIVEEQSGIGMHGLGVGDSYLGIALDPVALEIATKSITVKAHEGYEQFVSGIDEELLHMSLGH